MGLCKLMSLGFGKVVSVFLACLVSTIGGDDEDGGKTVAPQKDKHGRYVPQVISNKFFKMKSSIKQSHPHIVQMFEAEGTSQVEKRDIITNCFQGVCFHPYPYPTPI